MTDDFWKGKKVLVTGGSGFIGSHLIEMLLEHNLDVYATIHNKNSPMGNMLNIKKHRLINTIPWNLMNYNDCLKATEGIDIVMNLAAVVGGVGYNSKNHASLFYKNMHMFMNVLEASRINKVDRFLTVSSACVYPRDCMIPTPESDGFRDEPEPTNAGYGWAKRMIEYMSKTYAEQYGMEITIARPYNCYGPRDNFNPESSHVIPALIKKVMESDGSIDVWGHGDQTRSFLYVKDFVRGLMMATEKYAVADPVNIGEDDEISMNGLIEMIMDITGKHPDIKYDMSKPMGQMRRRCDSTKALREFGFTTQTSLRKGLEETIEWYKKNRKS